MDEKKWKEVIQRSTRDLKIPDSLSPKEVKDLIKGKSQKKAMNFFPLVLGAGVCALLVFYFIWNEERERIPREEIVLAEGEEEKERGIEEEIKDISILLKGGLHTAKSYEELETALLDWRLENLRKEVSYLEDGAALEDGVATGGYLPRASMGIEEQKQAKIETETAYTRVENYREDVKDDYSHTNVQEQGVEEGDILKTDGSYLYVLNREEGKVTIVKAGGDILKEEGNILLSTLDEEVEEMYLDKERLYLITRGTKHSVEEDRKVRDTYYLSQNGYTTLYTYDIANKNSPKLMGKVEVDGAFRTSRKTGDYFYIFTEYTPQFVTRYTADFEGKEELRGFIPLAGGEKMPASHIFLPDTIQNSSYLVIASVNVHAPESIADSKAMVSSASLFYVSEENIYITLPDFQQGEEETQILKFHYENGNIEAKGAGKVKGRLKDSFSMNEYKGYLRLVTTNYTNEGEKNSLFVLDEQLNICGRVENLAEGETIQSARFLGDMGYFVTFRQTDPLFAVDLKDPNRPSILGELKVTGFSSYLHFYGGSLLFGLGYEVDAYSGEQLGVKLSMFDITDPAKMIEENRHVLQKEYACPALENYRALTIHPQKNIIGFLCGDEYYVFSYEKEKGFQIHLKEKGFSEDVRGAYIGDIFYVADKNKINAYHMKNGFTKTGELNFTS